MNGNRFLLALCLLPLGLYSQIQMQAGFGFKVGIDRYGNFSNLDNAQIRFFSPTLGSNYWFLAASHKFKERLSLRLSLEVYGIRPRIMVYEPTGMDFNFQIINQFFRNQFNLPIELQFQLVKGIYLSGGIMVSKMLKTKLSGIWVVRESAQLYWTDEEIDLLLETVDVFRLYQMSYRYGLTVRPFKRIGVELLYSYPLTNLIRSPVSYKGVEEEIDFRHRTTTVKLVYYFDIGKKKDK